MAEQTDCKNQCRRESDEALVLSLVVLLLHQGKNTVLVMALLYILS